MSNICASLFILNSVKKETSHIQLFLFPANFLCKYFNSDLKNGDKWNKVHRH